MIITGDHHHDGDLFPLFLDLREGAMLRAAMINQSEARRSLTPVSIECVSLRVQEVGMG